MRIRLGHCRDEGDNTELHSRRKANNTEYTAPHRKEVIQTQLCVIGGDDVQLRFDDSTPTRIQLRTLRTLF